VSGPKGVQCKHIAEEPILRLLRSFDGKWATWRDTDLMPTVVPAFPAGTPAKVVMAKMASLIRRGLVDGCTCGCRGDYVLTDRGAEWPRRRYGA